jgi:hypothetical protein
MWRLGFLCLACGVAGIAQARTYNYEDIPLGERSFGMGKSAMALDQPDTGVMFYNPATLALTTHAQVSTSLSAFSRIDTRTGEYVSLFKSARENISRTGFLAIPSMVGGHLRWRDWVWGGTILVPFSYGNSGQVNIDRNNIGSFEANDSSYWFGFFAARQFTPRWSFGASLFYLSRSNNEKFFFIRRSSPFEITYFEEGFGAAGMALILGGTYLIDEGLRLGFSWRPPAVRMGGNTYVISVGSGRNLTEHTGKIAFYPLPMRISGGLSWQVHPQVTLAGDVHIYTALKGNLGELGEIKESVIDAKAIANYSLGIEYMGWKEFGLRFGVFTNFSSARYAPKTLTAINDKVDMYGSTVALVMVKHEGTISLGGYIQGGQGKAPAISDAPETVVPRSNYIYGFVLGSSYRF